MRARTGQPPRELRLLHAAGGLVVFVSVVVPADMTLPDAHELASRLEDEIRERPTAHARRRRPHRALTRLSPTPALGVSRYPALVLAACSLGMSLILMDTTVVNIAAPTIRDDLDASASSAR